LQFYPFDNSRAIYSSNFASLKFIQMKKIFTFTLALTIIGLQVNAQLSTTKNPGAVLQSTTTTGSYAFTITSSAADCNLPQGFLYGMSKGMNLSNFGFNIPSTATIVGVTSQITYSTMVSGSTWTALPRDTTILLLKSGVEVGTNHAIGILGSSTLTSPPSGRYKTYGTPTDLWGTTLTPGDVNSTEFGMAIYMAHYPYKSEVSAVILNNTLSLTPNPTPSMTIYYLVSSTGIVQSQTSIAKMYSYNKFIRLSEPLSQTAEITVYDLLGNKVHHSFIEAGQSTVNLEQLNAGVYIYKLKQGNNEQVQKIKLD
jgi:hypothetical protein